MLMIPCGTSAPFCRLILYLCLQICDKQDHPQELDEDLGISLDLVWNLIGYSLKEVFWTCTTGRPMTCWK